MVFGFGSTAKHLRRIEEALAAGIDPDSLPGLPGMSAAEYTESRRRFILQNGRADGPFPGPGGMAAYYGMTRGEYLGLPLDADLEAMGIHVHPLERLIPDRRLEQMESFRGGGGGRRGGYPRGSYEDDFFPPPGPFAGRSGGGGARGRGGGMMGEGMAQRGHRRHEPRGRPRGQSQGAEGRRGPSGGDPRRRRPSPGEADDLYMRDRVW